MTTLNDAVLDAGLQVLRDAVTPVLHICSQEPTTYTEAATTYTLGNKSAPTLTAQANDSRLLFTAPITSAPIAVTSGADLKLTSALIVAIGDPA